MKVSTVALVLSVDSGLPLLVEALHDEYEIEFMEIAIRSGQLNALQQIHEHRDRINKQENEFGDYVEELLSQPFLRREIQTHGVQWLKSKIKIEKYQKTENEAVQVISDYAYNLYKNDPGRTDFFLASPMSQIRIRIFVLPSSVAVAPNSAKLA